MNIVLTVGEIEAVIGGPANPPIRVRMEQVIIGVDPHKLSATIEVVDDHEQRLGQGRFATDKAGFAAMRRYARAWPERT